MNESRIPERGETDCAFAWDLTPLFPGEAEWESLYGALEKKITGYDVFRGRLGDSAASLRDAIEFDLDISRSLDRLYTYAHLRSDENKADGSHLGRLQRAITLYTKISELASFMTPEIQGIDEERMRSFLEDGALSGYVFYLQRILRDKPHTLSQEIEQILAMGAEISMAPSQIFGQLDNADMRFGNIADETGAERELSHGNFSSFLMNRDRGVRKAAFEKYYAAYDSVKNTIAAALSHSVKKDYFHARVRKFDGCREAAMFSDNVPAAVYDTLVNAVKDNLRPLHEYFLLRRDALKLPDLHFYDTYVPLVENVDFTMPYEKAVDVCVSSLSVLGDEYTAVLRKGLLEGWVDRYENRGKRSGAYSSGCYDSPPYILMNYRDDAINSLYTLIHEAGHSMHSYFSNKRQPYVYHNYTIFAAEVASTFNETLLTRHLLETYRDDPAMTAYILNREIDDIRATLHRQTMFAEFEAVTHAMAEKGEPLTLDAFRDVYRVLLETYLGSGMVIDENLSLECLRIPHFYSPFYVYKYATGISAAIALAEMVRSGGKAERDRYLNFLSLGGSMYPLDELRDAGVDMSRPEPVRSAIGYFGMLVDRLRESLKAL